MSSSSSATDADVQHNRRSYCCHGCDTSVLILSSSDPSPILCPQCRLEFLRGMDDCSSLFDVNDDDDDDDPAVNFDDYFLPDSPYLHRLLRHLASERSGSSSSSTSPDIDSIPTVQISSSMLCCVDDPDSGILCAVCKEDFCVGESARRLPCTHLYHSDCIIPWLTDHSSCPLCRFELPVSSEGGGCREAARGIRWSDLVAIEEGDEEDDEEDEDGDWLGLGGAFRRIARRRMVGVGTADREHSQTVSGQRADGVREENADAIVGTL